MDATTNHALRFTTLRVGVLVVRYDEHTIENDVRILRASDGSYRALSGALSERYASEGDAAESIERAVASSNGTCVLCWRSDLSPETGEQACPMCAAPTTFLARYPRKLCPACALEATDEAGRPLRFGNIDMFGGFEAQYADDGTVRQGGECFVRGVRCLAEEGRFGGVVLQPT